MLEGMNGNARSSFVNSDRFPEDSDEIQTAINAGLIDYQDEVAALYRVMSDPASSQDKMHAVLAQFDTLLACGLKKVDIPERDERSAEETLLDYYDRSIDELKMKRLTDTISH